MNSRSWKIFYIAMIIGTCIPLIFDYRISLGFLLGSLEAIVGAYLPTQWLDFAIYGSMAILWLAIPRRAKTA